MSGLFRKSACSLIAFVLTFALTASAHVGASVAGDRLFSEAKFNQAADAYAQALRTNPKDLDSRLGLIRTLLRLDNSRWRDAIREGRSATALASHNTDAHGLLAMALMRGGQPDAAATEADRALALDANSYYGLVAQGRVSLWNEHKEDAEKSLRKAVQLRPTQPDAYFYLLDILYGKDGKDHAEIKKIEDAYLKLNPKGHPHDRVIDELQQTRIRTPIKSNEKAGQVFTSESPYNEAQMKAADAGDSEPVLSTVPIERNGDDIILPIKVNGETFHLLFDTGAGDDFVLNDEALARLNLVPLGQTIARGVSGKEVSQIYKVDKVQIGTQTYRNVPLESMSKLGAADGLIGGAVFDDCAVTVDFHENTMLLARGKKAVAPPPAEGNHIMTVPFHIVANHILVPMRLADRPQTEWGLLDTGAQGLGILSLITARDLAKKQNEDSFEEFEINQRVGVGHNSTRFTALRFRFAIDLALCNSSGTPFFMEMNPIAGASLIDEQVCPDFDFQLSAIVGISYLTNARRVTFDYPHRILTMEFAN